MREGKPPPTGDGTLPGMGGGEAHASTVASQPGDKANASTIAAPVMHRSRQDSARRSSSESPSYRGSLRRSSSTRWRAQRADRFASAKDLAEELRSFAAGKLVALHSYSTGQLIRRSIARHRVVVGVTTAALVVIGLVGTFAIKDVMHQRDVAETARQAGSHERDTLVYNKHSMHSRAIRVSRPHGSSVRRIAL